MNVATIAGLLRERAQLLTADLVQRALATVGVRGIDVTVDLVVSIPRTALGKAPLIRRAQLATAGH